MKKRFMMHGVLALGVAGLLTGTGIADDKRGEIPGPIDSIQDLQDTAKMLFKLADTNNDGQISQKEALDAGNLLVGGFFFRADANGDGTLTPEEARAARESLFQQQPLLRYVLQKAKPNNAAATDRGDQPAGPTGSEPGGQSGQGDRRHARHQPRPEDRGERAAPGGPDERADAVHHGRREPGRPVEPRRAQSSRRRSGQDGGADGVPGGGCRP